MKRVFLGMTVRIFLIGSIGIAGILYLVKVNTVTTEGLVISDLEAQIRELERENKKLDVEIAEHRSMRSIEERMQGMELVVAEDMRYVSELDTVVARR